METINVGQEKTHCMNIVLETVFRHHPCLIVDRATYLNIIALFWLRMVHIINTVEAASMGRFGTGYFCLLYTLSLLSVGQYIWFFSGDQNMRAY